MFSAKAGTQNEKRAIWVLHRIANKVIRGHAAWFQRAFSYLLIGGLSMVVNLLVFSLVYYRVAWPADQQWRVVVFFAVLLVFFQA